MPVLFKSALSARVNLNPNFGWHGPQFDGSPHVSIGQAETSPVTVNQVKRPSGLPLYHCHLQASAFAKAAVCFSASSKREESKYCQGKEGKPGPRHHNIPTTCQPA